MEPQRIRYLLELEPPDVARSFRRTAALGCAILAAAGAAATVADHELNHGHIAKQIFENTTTDK